MSDAPWSGDACGLVDAFRTGERSPLDELEATLAAIESSDLNAFSFVDAERARAAAATADVAPPVRRCPDGREGTRAARRLAATPRRRWSFATGWPITRACTSIGCSEGGAVPVGLTTASEFGGLNVSVTKLQRRHPQSLGARAHRRRIVGRIGGCGRRRAGEPGDRR